MKRMEFFFVVSFLFMSVCLGYIAYKLTQDENVICYFAQGNTKAQIANPPPNK
jgi:hypothetical protein